MKMEIKTRLYGSFHENLWPNLLTHFVGHFWLAEAKMKIKMKKIGKISSGFGFSISKLGYVAIFMKIWEKNSLTHFLRRFLPFLKTFFTNPGKNEDDDEKNLEKWVRFLNSPY